MKIWKDGQWWLLIETVSFSRSRRFVLKPPMGERGMMCKLRAGDCSSSICFSSTFNQGVKQHTEAMSSMRGSEDSPPFPPGLESSINYMNTSFCSVPQTGNDFSPSVPQCVCLTNSFICLLEIDLNTNECSVEVGTTSPVAFNCTSATTPVYTALDMRTLSSMCHRCPACCHLHRPLASRRDEERQEKGVTLLSACQFHMFVCH